MDTIIPAILQASIVSKAVLALLLLMSVVSWAYMLGKWVCLRTAQKDVARGLETIDADDLMSALPALERNARSPLFGITRRGVLEVNRSNRTGAAAQLVNDNLRRALHFGIAEELGSL